MNLFYVPPGYISGDRATFPPEEAKHAAQVLRIAEGDTVHFTDGIGGAYQARVLRVQKNHLETGIISRERREPDPVQYHIALGYIRQNQRLEFAVEKLTELGIHEITIFYAEHSEPGRVKPERLEKIIRAASKQSLRYWFPELVVCNSLSEFLQKHTEYRIIAAHEKDGEVISPNVLQNEPRLAGIVGPEGGLSDAEIETINSHEGLIVSLGEQRLRAETAAVVLAGQMVVQP